MAEKMASKIPVRAILLDGWIAIDDVDDTHRGAQHAKDDAEDSQDRDEEGVDLVDERSR